MPSPQRRITVTDTATLLVGADPTNRPVWMQILGNTTVYIGDSAVTDTNGFPIAKHAAPLQGALGPGQALYGICSAGTTETVCIFTAPEDV